jgi:Na+/melibiose symporter-like transporter
MNNPTQKISVVEKIGYSLGDLAANLIFQTLMTFLAFFYTDVYKIPPATASFIIFFGGMFGAFFYPIMGNHSRQDQYPMGQISVPGSYGPQYRLAPMAILAFSTPVFSPSGKVAYAFITYLLLVVVFSANNLPTLR